MSYQVADQCYATVPDAGVAACASHVPVSQLTSAGDAIRSLSCSGADPVTGALQMVITTTPVAGGASTVQTVAHELAYLPCQQEMHVEAYTTIFAAVLGCVVSAYGAWMIKRWIDRGAREQSV